MRLRKILPFLCLILLGLFPRLSLADPSHTTIWDFDEDVTSVVPHEDGFIVLAGTQLWFCDPSLEQPEPQLLFENDSLRQMLSDGQGNLYAFAYMMYQGAWSNVLAEVSLSTQTLTPMLVLDNLPSVGDSAVLQTENGPMLAWVSASSPYNDLFFCDLSSQKKDTWYGKSIQALATDGSEMLFGASFGSLYTKDGNEWKQQEGFALPPAIRGFCYDPYQQRICVIDGSCAIAYALTGEEIVRTYLPVAYENLSIRPCAIQASGLLAIGDGPRLITLPAYAGSTSEAVLTIVSPMEEGPETRRFRLSHPEVQVNTVNTHYALTPAEIYNRIRGGDDQTDIFITRTFETGYAALMEKGFFYDLSSSEFLSSEIAQMPETFTRPLYCGDQLVGIPLALKFTNFWQLDCILDTFEDVGIDPRELPDNLLELMQQLQAWYEDGTLRGVCLFEGGSRSQYFIFSWFLMQHYVYAASAEDTPTIMDQALFETLMLQCDALFETMRSGASPAQGPALFDTANDPLNYNDSRYLLTLTPAPNVDLHCSAYFDVALVNPLSQHKEQAVAYLEAVLQEMPPEERLLLWPNLAQPVERDGYQEEYAALQDELDRLNALPDEERLISEIQSAIFLTEFELDGLKRYHRWALSEEEIAAYHSFSDNVYILTDTQESLLDEDTRDLLQQYTDGRIDVQRLMDELCRKESMMQMEQ